MPEPRPLRDDDVAGLARRTPLVVLLDVDGTLAPIAPTPAEARVPAETREVVARLLELPGVHVALVTGRVATEGLEMVSVDGLWVIGNHGAERRTPGGQEEVDEGVAAFGPAMARAAGALTMELSGIGGSFVEYKRWGLTVHTRLADRADVPRVEALARGAAAREGLRVVVGKEVFELRAPADVDKGTASLALLDRLGARTSAAGVLYVGDDTTDEDAFRRLRAADVHAVTVRVGPPETSTAAEIVVDDPAAVRALLERLVASR